jgi:hypothetical protein
MNKELYTATVKELENWPGVTLTEEQGKGHCKAFLHFNGQSRMVIVSNTPSDVRALPNHIALVRRELRGMGAEKAHVVVGEPKTRAPHLSIITEEIPMSRENKIDAILKQISDLRYSEMIEFAALLRDVATVTNMRRGHALSWANMLQTAVDQNSKN